MNKSSIDEIAKKLTVKQNVTIQVLDRLTGEVIQEISGHNDATNSLLYGVAHHLVGDFMPNEGHGLNPGYSMLSNYVPRYISLGTMGLINQEQDKYGLPAGIGDFLPSSSDPEYQALIQAMNAAKENLDAAEAALENECPYYPATTACESCQVCSDRIAAKKQARDDAQDTYDAAVEAVMTYNEEARFVEYMKRTPGYGADGYDDSENNNRDYPGLGWPWTSYDVTSSYKAVSNDTVSYKGTLYECIQDTLVPAGPFDPTYWKILSDVEQPSIDTTVNLELISPSFPRMPISYREVVPEYAAESAKTIDVVYSAMVSTGALKQFRPEGQDYIFITEAGLWSKKTWEDGNENGLLAGYRIVPPNEKNWDMTVPENRQILKENVLKVGANQVVQVVWKIQIGSLAQMIPTKVVHEDTPKYYDGAYMSLVPSYFSSDIAKIMYMHLYTHRSDDTYGSYPPDIPVAFRRSPIKRGHPVPQVYSKTPEVIYMDFEMDAGGQTQTVWWWTQEGKMTLQSSTYFEYWTYFYNQSTSSFYYIDASNCYINTGVCNGWYGLITRPDLGIDHVTIDLTNATLGPGFRIGFYSHGSYNKPVRVIGADQTHVQMTSGYFFSSAVETYGDVFLDDLVKYSSVQVGNIYKSYTPGSTIYCRNYIIPQSYSRLIYLLDSYQNPITIDVSNWNLSNCTSLNSLLSINTADQDVTVRGFSTWDVSTITNMHQLFSRITHMYESLASWNVSNVTDMGSMFDCTNWPREVIESIANWDVSACLDFSYMFFNYSSSNRGYDDYSFLDSWEVNTTADFSQILPSSSYITRFPTWNGWFAPQQGCTFIPYMGSDVTRCYFRGMIGAAELLPEIAAEGDSYYTYSGSDHMYYYHNGEWVVYTAS
ncbi:MAG: BspA family leucine-rich repeat surface protein [Bacteroidaceae bacterium]|nr:BspA family leucine-rich repeat surface protein [Bacteroidaceae bacterium]